jgi:hypothetical protein
MPKLLGIFLLVIVLFIVHRRSALGQGSVFALALLGSGVLSLLLSAVPPAVAFVPLVHELGPLGIPVFLMAGLVGSFCLWLGICTGWFL